MAEVKECEFNLSVISYFYFIKVFCNLMFLFYESMACAVYLRKLIIFILFFHTVAINHYKNIKSIVNNLYEKITDAKSKRNHKLPTSQPSEHKRYAVTATTKITQSKDRLSIVTSQMERRTKSTAVAQVITVAAEKKRRR